MTLHKLRPDPAIPAVWAHRGEGVDAVHSAVVAVADAESRLTHSLGDVEQVFFARSSIKPMQALPLVEAGGVSRFGLDDRELALCAASHSGSDEHRAVALGLLQKLELPPSALLCGAGYPLGMKLLGQYPLHGEDRDVLRHNCSGKHCGFLALAKLFGQRTEAYLDPQGPSQKLVRASVAGCCEVAEASLLLGIDGCSAPNYALPIRALSVGMKNVMLARSEPLARVRHAMLEHPILVSGEGRLDYDVARAFPGRVLVKGGAEAILLAAFQEPDLGIAIKVVDGASRALGPILVETLVQLGLVSDISQYPTLRAHAAPTLKNARNLDVGALRADFELTIH